VTREAAVAAIEPLITELIRAAPARPAGIVDELIEQLLRVGTPLARTIARVVELVADDLVDPGVALPALAMACATLADGVRGVLGERELEAARYEIDTLLPVPDPPRPPAAPDVPVSSLRRRS
jgi:hypothetical protein